MPHAESDPEGEHGEHRVVQVHPPRRPRFDPAEPGILERPRRLDVHRLDPATGDQPQRAEAHHRAEDDPKRGERRDIDGTHRGLAQAHRSHYTCGSAADRLADWLLDWSPVPHVINRLAVVPAGTGVAVG
jgi:hypothetical protein